MKRIYLTLISLSHRAWHRVMPSDLASGLRRPICLMTLKWIKTMIVLGVTAR